MKKSSSAPVLARAQSAVSTDVENKSTQMQTVVAQISAMQMQLHAQATTTGLLQQQVDHQSGTIRSLEQKIVSLQELLRSQQQQYHLMQSNIIRQVISRQCSDISSAHEINQILLALRSIKIPFNQNVVDVLLEYSTSYLLGSAPEQRAAAFCFDELIQIQDDEGAMLTDYLARIQPCIVTIATSDEKCLDQLRLLKNCKTFVEGKATSTQCMSHLVANMLGCRWTIDLSKQQEHICAVTRKIQPNSSLVLPTLSPYATTESQHDAQQLKVCAMISAAPDDVEIVIDRWISGYPAKALSQLAQCIKANAIVCFSGDSIAQPEALELLKNIENKCTIGFNLAAIEQQTEVVARSINDACLLKLHYSLDPTTGNFSSTSSHRETLSRKLMTIILFKLNLGKAIFSYDRLSLNPSDISSINSTLINMNKKLGQSTALLSGHSSSADASSVAENAWG